MLKYTFLYSTNKNKLKLFIENFRGYSTLDGHGLVLMGSVFFPIVATNSEKRFS